MEKNVASYNRIDGQAFLCTEDKKPGAISTQILYITCSHKV